MSSRGSGFGMLPLGKTWDITVACINMWYYTVLSTNLSLL